MLIKSDGVCHNVIYVEENPSFSIKENGIVKVITRKRKGRK